MEKRKFRKGKIKISILIFFYTIYSGIHKVHTKFEVGHDKLYGVTKNQPHIAYQYIYFFIFLSLKQKFMSGFSAPVEAGVFRFCIHF